GFGTFLSNPCNHARNIRAVSNEQIPHVRTLQIPHLGRIEIVERHRGESIVCRPELRQTGCGDQQEPVGGHRGQFDGRFPHDASIQFQPSDEAMLDCTIGESDLEFLLFYEEAPFGQRSDFKSIPSRLQVREVEFQIDRKVVRMPGAPTPNRVDSASRLYRVIERGL
ncbi:MAG TPA: hypothetical protein VHB77_19715, partial [Planctomycetaceae bacterium]|nr:hypothetical protein [Planctomycetaceae bacterium]